jgi:hypothetical protein
MITRERLEPQKEQQQDNRNKKGRRKSDWRKLIDELERRGSYVDRAIIADPRERRGRISK